MASRLICWLTIALIVPVLGLCPLRAMAQQQLQTPTTPLLQGSSAVDLSPLSNAQSSASTISFTLNNLWVIIAASLVFIMNLGFGCLESGLTRAKNAVNIYFKNTIVPCIGVLCFAMIGFGLMYPDHHWLIPGLLGWEGLGLRTADGPTTPSFGPCSYLAFFLFQAMFASTAATIVSGAVAERIKLASFLVFTALMICFCYPIIGSWIWGGGWLWRMGFHDFAGSTAVHSVGGWSALVGAWMVGPRLGKYAKDGTSNAIPGHNLGLAMIGVFLLWWGWFGFNGGSTLSVEPLALAGICLMTMLAACAGGVSAMFCSWLLQKKPDFTMVLNGILAGLVAITAGCDMYGPEASVVIGAVAGVLVVFAVIIIDQKIRVDDPVGALSVHLVNGVWGTLAVGIFGTGAGLHLLGVQMIGVTAVAVSCLVFNFIVWSAIKAIMGLRVSDQEQMEGLDLGEHDQAAYPDFQQTYIKSYHIREA